MNTLDWEELTVIEGLIEAQIIKAKLEGEGIPVYLRFESAGHIFGITMNGLGKVKVMVPRKDLTQAFELIKDSRSPHPFKDS